jgi:Mn2+/Fe2+ NRAMP family transporter
MARVVRQDTRRTVNYERRGAGVRHNQGGAGQEDLDRADQRAVYRVRELGLAVFGVVSCMVSPSSSIGSHVKIAVECVLDKFVQHYLSKKKFFLLFSLVFFFFC